MEYMPDELSMQSGDDAGAFPIALAMRGSAEIEDAVMLADRL